MDLMAVKFRSDALDIKGADRWFVTDGLAAVGPVRLDLLARGVAAGRVPLDSFVRHEGWKVWRPLTDFTEYVDDGAAAPHTEAGPTTRVPLSALTFMEEERSVDDRATVELGSGEDGELELKSFASTGEVPTLGSRGLSAPGDASHGAADVPTQGSRDLLGADRPTLASYLDDDEETKVPEKRKSVAPSPSAPRARSVPPPPPVGPPQRRTLPPPSIPPPRPRTIPPGAGSPAPATAAPVTAAPVTKGSVPPPAALPRVSGVVTPGGRSSQPPQSSALVGARAEGTDDVQGSRAGWGYAQPFESGEILPEDDLAGAADLSDALLLLLGAAVRRCHAEVALLHRLADEGATVACAHGPGTLDLLGTRTRLLDPAVVAAAGGHIVVAEPVAGNAGEATMARLRKSGLDPEGAAMFPLRPRNRLLGFLELGRRSRFTLRELSRVEELVAAFSERAAESGWTP